MSDTIETVIEAATDPAGIAVPKTAAAVVTAFAIYGGFDLTRKAAGKVAKIREDRKAKKDVKEEKTETPTDQS
jgi:hypothetical protein